jgi:hypothetical protein
MERKIGLRYSKVSAGSRKVERGELKRRKVNSELEVIRVCSN